MNFRPQLVLAALLCIAVLAPTQQGWAQEGEQQQEQKTRRSEAMSERVHRRLSDAQEALDADDFVTAEAKLREIMELRNITPYEAAQANRFLGYVHLKKDDFPRAIEAFLRVTQVGGEDVIGRLHNEIIKILSKLYMLVENYSEAVRYGLQWLDSSENPPPRDYMLMAKAYYHMEQWRDSLDYTTLAIEKAQATGVDVQENWWGIKWAAYWELEQYADALEVTRILLSQWPKKSYWLQLGGLYAIEEDEPRQLAAYWSTFDQGIMDRSQELTAIAQLLMLAEVPYKAAVILQEGLDSGSIEETASNYRLSAQAWLMAQEYAKALQPMRKAAESEENVEDKSALYVRLAETHSALGDYEQCVSAVREAIRLGSLKSEGHTHITLGQCLFELEKYDEAGEALTRAARDEETRRSATRLKNYYTNEVARLRDLEARLAQYAD